MSHRDLGDVLYCLISDAFGTFEDRNAVFFKAENQNSSGTDTSVFSH